MCKDYASEILIHIIEFKSFVQLKLSHKSDVENYPGDFFYHVLLLYRCLFYSPTIYLKDKSVPSSPSQ